MGSLVCGPAQACGILYFPIVPGVTAPFGCCYWTQPAHPPWAEHVASLGLWLGAGDAVRLGEPQDLAVVMELGKAMIHCPHDPRSVGSSGRAVQGTDSSFVPAPAQCCHHCKIPALAPEQLPVLPALLPAGVNRNPGSMGS